MSQDASPTRPHDALNGGRAQTTEQESRDWGHSRVRGKDRQKELDRHDEAEMCSRYEMRKPRVWSSQHREEEASQSPSHTMKQGGWSAEQLVPRSEMSNFLKLKEEVVKHTQSYIWRHA